MFGCNRGTEKQLAEIVRTLKDMNDNIRGTSGYQDTSLELIDCEENKDKDRDEENNSPEKSMKKKYNVNDTLERLVKISGLFVAVSAVISIVNIAIWSLISSGFNISISFYLLSKGVGSAFNFQSIAIFPALTTIFILLNVYLFNKSVDGNRGLKVNLLFLWFASGIFNIGLVAGIFLKTPNLLKEGILDQETPWGRILLFFGSIAISISFAYVMYTLVFGDLESEDKKYQSGKPIDISKIICYSGSIVIILSFMWPVHVYYKGYGSECFEVSKNSVSDRVLRKIPENNLTDDQKNKIRESLKESWSVLGEEGEKFSIFVTREDKDTIDGVLFKKDGKDMRSSGKVVTINRKAIKTRDVCHQ
ncbi:hypothetical protein [Rothia dentocariosa]|uniref:hypothetical protein n=1 Tax=Rothia dentocariosa TaxID=2047 RepID=UPI0028E62F0B|nr:hypothetical protein [Rothia dentocariosa]